MSEPVDITIAQPEAERCPACQAKMKGKFCRKCGEKRFRHSDLSLSRLAREFWSKITHADSRTWTTFKLLFLHPGFLTRQYCTGVRKPYLKPVQVFFIANVLYFIGLMFFTNDVFYFPLRNYVRFHPFGVDFEAWAQAAAVGKGMTWADFTAAFDAQMQTQVKTWIVLNVPLLALLMALLYANQRRFLVEHLVFALHFYAFVMVYICLLSFTGILLFNLNEWLGLGNWARWIIEFLAVAMFIYLAVAMKRYYGEKWVWTLVRLAPLYYGIIMVLNLYRLMMFWIVLQLV